MHSERLAYIEKLNDAQELTVKDVRALIADNRSYETALHEARQFIVIACGDQAPYVKAALARIDAALNVLAAETV